MSTPLQWAWLAGLIDGEGCIVINRQRAEGRKDLRTDSFRLFLQVTMGDRRALDHCRKIAGCGSVQPHNVSNKKANAAWCWMTSAKDAEYVLRNVLKHLIIKQDEALVALDFRKLKCVRQCGSRWMTPKTQSMVDSMATAYWRLRMLKSRWRFYHRQLPKWARDEISRLDLKV